MLEPLAAGKDITVEIQTMFSYALQPYPAEIRQADKQLVLFRGSTHLYSPYKVATQTTTVKLASSVIESYTKTPKPVAKNEAELTYGPYENTDALFKVRMLQIKKLESFINCHNPDKSQM